LTTAQQAVTVIAMDIDRVVAHNLRRLREEKGVSVAELARDLGVGKHLIYDFERPRRGKEQRQFLWSEIVMLCRGLGVTIFELVLPASGEAMGIPGSMGGSQEFQQWWNPDERGFLMETLFGIQFEPEDIDKLVDMRQRRVEKMAGELLQLLKGNDR